MSNLRWIFGYGSLVWRPQFVAEEQQPAYIVHWARRFWQGSTDHRGVPGAPGRVVTLIAERGAVTWGMAYRVRRDDYSRIVENLDHREKGGYVREEVDLNLSSGRTARGLLYRATEENQNYLGPASLESIALQVKGSRGPSGHNAEYVLKLAEWLRVMKLTDEHVEALAALLVR